MIERLVIGLGTACLVPQYVPWVGSRRFAAVFLAGALAAWTLYPLGTRYAEWSVAAVLTGAQWLLVGLASPRRPVRWRFPSIPEVGAALTVVIAIAAAFARDSRASAEGLRGAVQSDAALLITCGLLLALFPCGVLIGRLTSSWSDAIERQLEDSDALPKGLQGAGRAIGWLERTLIYLALIIARPEAVAVIFTAKSIARFPSFSRESFAEYYLLGTLLSVLAGAGAAVSIRLLLGWTAV